MNKFIRAIDIMSKEFYVVDRNAVIYDAAKLMIKYKTNFLIVMESTKPVGILTEKDIMVSISNEKDLKKETVGGVMSSPMVTVDYEISFYDIIKMMRKKKLKKIPVVKKKVIIGSITEKDVNRGIIYIIKIMNEKLRKGHISLKDHTSQEGDLIKLVEEINKKEPPWVKKEIKLLEEIYQKQQDVIKQLSKKTRKYNLTDWRTYIWMHCKYKKEKTEKEDIIYMCKKTDKYCVFEACPLNYE